MRRLAIAALALASIAVTLLFAAGLVADLYGTISGEQRARGGSNLAGISAAQHAALLQPWRPLFHLDLGWTLGVRGDTPRMRIQYEKALRWAPASAYAWLEYAQALARSYRFDSQYTLAIARATALAPNAPPVQLGAARMGTRHWNLGDEGDRRIWAQNMTYVLRNEPYDLLWTVLQEGRESSFCGFVGSELGLSRWCFAVAAGRRICDALPAGAKGAAAEQCARLGLLRRKQESDDAALKQP